MKINTRALITGLFCLSTSFLSAQIIERERPQEWSQLVNGGRFMDRFLAMPDGKLSKDVWGAADVVPRYIDNGIELSHISIWGGNILQTDDQKYHLFVCGWPESASKGHMEWPNSTVYHAVGEKLSGPFTIQDTIGKGHNPEAFRLKDGRIVIYVIDGYYLADSVEGPWSYQKFTFNPRDRRIIEGLSNLTFARREDGSYLMICRGGGVWISKTGLAPYNQLTNKRVYPAVKGEFEDPVVWRDHIQYHLIVNDWLGRIAFYQRSKDGIHWITEAGEAYVPGVSFHKDGHIEKWFKYERPKVFQDNYGRAIQMNFAVIDTIKWEDLGNDNHSSKNICMPLNKGLLLSVLNKKAVTGKTSTIKVKISAEEGFDPQAEVDIASLRFGSHNEVNFGRGSKPVTSKKSGKDLIVVFDGTGSGITAEEFAPKLIGKNKQGEMIFGYARLPHVDYNAPLLSSRKPIYNEKNNEIRLEVENFGLSASKADKIAVSLNDTEVASGKIKALQPYEVTQISFKTEKAINWDNAQYKVVFYQNGEKIEENLFQ